MSDARPPRADALRNRQRVLEVAREVFATEGLAVPIDKIADLAGVGVGTLYRHFPTKEALYAAVVLTRLENAAAEARDLAKAPDPEAAFFRFLGLLVQEGSAKKDLAEALATSGPQVKESIVGAKKELGTALGKLLARAQRAGAVRRDATVADVFALIHGPFAAMGPQGADPAARQRLFGIVCDGLREQKRASARST
ncbi:MAG TPA: helix-turn-helix domain-containing protein [Polyangiaceae bacterium]|jgi:AcrR family transcriptional regulator|nr:helix-turn-helix domain-containing protein [Polyangiaceae bacterium]